MKELFHSFVYQPIYNALAVAVDFVPGGDVGVAIIIVTILVRCVLFPLSMAAIRTQMAMREIEPELKKIREEHKENKEELARRTMAIFKEKKINPLASFFLILVQLPVVIGLYLVLQNESTVVSFDPALLYSFVQVPEHASLVFLGLIALTGKSIVLALLVSATQFVYAKLIVPPHQAKPIAKGSEPSFQDDLAKSMNMQMRFVFPVILGVIAYATSAAIALYFIVSNTFSIGQELLVRRIHDAKR